MAPSDGLRPLSPLWLCRHGVAATSSRDRGTRDRSRSPHHRYLDGRDARLDVRCASSRRNGRAHSDCGAADADCGSQPAVASHPDAGDQKRSAVEGGELHGAAARHPLDHANVRHARAEPGDAGDIDSLLSRCRYASRRAARRERSQKTMPTTSSTVSRRHTTATSWASSIAFALRS